MFHIGHSLNDLTKGKEVQPYQRKHLAGLGSTFVIQKKFVQIMDKLILDFCGGTVQYMTNWNNQLQNLKETKLT